MSRIKQEAKAYAERVCNGEFPITYTREQVVHHTKNDFEQGALYTSGKLLGVLERTKNSIELLSESYGGKILDLLEIVNNDIKQALADFEGETK